MTDSPDDIFCGEIGAPDAERWSEPVVLSGADRASVDALVAGGTLEVDADLRTGAVRLAGVDRVGTIRLPSGRRLSIRPKIGPVRLLEWIAYLDDVPAPDDATVAVDVGGDVHDLLIDWYVAELERLTRAGVRPAYASVRTESAAVRGRLVAGAVARRVSVLPRIAQTRRVRSLDTPHNRLLAAALDRAVLIAAPAGAARNRAVALLDAWSGVPRTHGDVLALVAAGRWARPPGYGRAVQLAALLLTGSLPNAAPARASGPAFLISLAGLWERALRRMAAELQPLTGWSPVPDAQRTRRWHDGRDFADPVRWMTADVILRAPSGGRWVLDAKYKRGYGDESRDDRFQVTAYATAFDAGRGTLVYPTGERGAARRRVLLDTDVGDGRRVTIDSIELPMAAGPGACREALRQIVDPTQPREGRQRVAHGASRG